MLGLGTLAKKVFGTPNDRMVKSVRPLVAKINALEPEFAALSDDGIKAKTAEFQKRVQEGGESLDSVLRRTGGFLDALQQLPEDRHVLVASHGAALNALYLQIKGLPLSLFWTHRFGNCSIVRLGLSGGRLSVLEEYPEPVAPA